jgi:Sulfotransferase domain
MTGVLYCVSSMTDQRPLRLPDFIHVGPPRTGTTWLHEVLKVHVGLPREKETAFFDLHYGQGIESYADLFRHYPATLTLGEIGPNYFASALARERIRRHIPNCRILCTFREPAAALYSLYRRLRAWRLTIDRKFDTYWQRLVARGHDLCRYATHLRGWQQSFGSRRVLVLFYDDLCADPQAYLDRICDFVSVERVGLQGSSLADFRVNAAWAVSKFNPVSRVTNDSVGWLGRHGGAAMMSRLKGMRAWRVVRRRLVEEFEPLSRSSADEIRELVLSETEELERLTGRDLSNWRPGAPRIGERISQHSGADRPAPSSSEIDTRSRRSVG